MKRGRPKKTFSASGIIAEIEEEDVDDIRIVDTRQKTQIQPPPEKYWTANCIDAENLVNKGIKLIGVMSAFGNLPKRWIFDATKEKIEEILKEKNA